MVIARRVPPCDCGDRFAARAVLRQLSRSEKTFLRNPPTAIVLSKGAGIEYDDSHGSIRRSIKEGLLYAGATLCFYFRGGPQRLLTTYNSASPDDGPAAIRAISANAGLRTCHVIFRSGAVRSAGPVAT